MDAIKYRAPELIPGAILERKDLTLTAKRVYAVIRYCQGHRQTVCLAVPWIASRLGLSRQAVSRAVGRLIDNGLLTRQKKPRQSPIFSITRLSRKNFFLPLYSINSGHSAYTDLLLAYLKFRQGDKDRAWPHIKTICKDLGSSKSSVLRGLATLEADGLVKIDHAHGGLKQGNKYALTAKAFFVTKCDPKPVSGVSECNPIINTSKELKELNNPEKFSTSGLSEKRDLLLRYRIAPLVAIALAREHSQENIQNAVLNTAAQHELAGKKLKRFNPAGYIVAILNGSKRSGRAVKRNSFVKSQKQRFDHRELSQPCGRGEKWVDQQKRLLGVAS